jgi:hypothetical protein
MASLLRQPAPAGQKPVSPPKKLPGGLRVVIVGHASPRWKGAKRPQDADFKNRELSEKRMEEVRQIVDMRLQWLLGPNVPITYIYYGYDDPQEEWGRARIEGQARGSKDTLREAKGKRDSDDPQYRRVDVYIDDTARTEHYRPSKGTEKRKKKTTKWGVTVGMSGSIIVGAAGVILAVRLTNLDTGRTGDYHLLSAGGGSIGVGASAPFDDSYTEFETDRAVGFADFDGVLTRYSSLSVGLGPVGYEKAYLTFLGMGSGADGIDVGGANYGAKIGLGGSVTSGKLTMPGGAVGMDMYDVPKPDTPYETRDVEEHLHHAYFETGSALLSPSRRTELRNYVNASTVRFGHAPH